MKALQKALALGQVVEIQAMKQTQAQADAAQLLDGLAKAEVQQEAAAQRAADALAAWRASLTLEQGFDPVRSLAYAHWATKRQQEHDALARDVEHTRQQYAIAFSLVQLRQAETQAAEKIARDAKQRAIRSRDEHRLQETEDMFANRRSTR